MQIFGVPESDFVEVAPELMQALFAVTDGEKTIMRVLVYSVHLLELRGAVDREAIQ